MIPDRFDIIILGGGISGLGVAEAAALRGLKTAVIEKGKCCAATSASSLRIIHGGLRYLQDLDLPRVTASIKAQSYLLGRYPQYVKKLPCLMPLKPSGFLSRWPLSAASLAYNQLARAITGQPNGVRVIDTSEVDALKQYTHGILYWNDALLADPAGFALQLKGELQERGVQVVEGLAARAVATSGADLKVELADGGEVRAALVVNTLGPWLTSVAVAPELIPARARPRGWCKAFNVILRRQFESRYAIGILGEQKRSYFIVPRAEGSVIGTWYVPFTGSPDALAVNDKELSEFIDSFNRTGYPDKISSADVSGVEAGVLPMESVDQRGPVLYGRERIGREKGYLEVMSTKYTTFRTQAEKVVNLALK